MAKNPFAAAWRAEEKASSIEIEKILNGSMNAKAVLKKIDELTKDPALANKKPPTYISKAFENFLKIAVKLIQSDYPGMFIKTGLFYTAVDKKWRAEVGVMATYNKRKVGRAKYTIQPGDTLFNIAKSHYGDGGYYPAIAEANPTQVKMKGDFIIAHSQIILPALEVLEPKAASTTIDQNRSGIQGKKKGKEVHYPDVSVDYTASKKKSFVKNTGACILEATIALKGNITASKPGPIKLKFSEGAYSKELKAEIDKGLDAKILVDGKNSVVAVSTAITGPFGKASFAVTKDLKAKLTLGPVSRCVKIKGITYSFNLSAEVELFFMCVPRNLPPGVLAASEVNNGYNEAMFLSMGTVAIVATALGAAGAAPVIVGGATGGSTTVGYGTVAASGGTVVLSGM